MAQPDFAALLNARVDSDMRPIHTQPIVFDFEALARLNGVENRLAEIEQEKKAAALEQRTLGTTQGDVRMAGNNSEEAELKIERDRLVEDVVGSTCYARFKAPSADRQAELGDLSKAEGWSKIEQNRQLVLESFERWEWEGEEVTSITKADLERLLPKLSQGELYSISNPLVTLSGGEVALPKSVSAFKKTPSRGATLKSPSSKASR